MKIKPVKWIPASKPPNYLESVLMTGQNYRVCQGVYTPKPLAKTPAGFYLRTNAETITHVDWVEWWIPMPEKP